jgi:hypothetical protein
MLGFPIINSEDRTIFVPDKAAGRFTYNKNMFNLIGCEI